MKQFEITFKSNLEKAKDFINLTYALLGMGQWIGNTYFSDPYDDTDRDVKYTMQDLIDCIKDDIERSENLDGELVIADSTRFYGSYHTMKEFELMNGGTWM